MKKLTYLACAAFLAIALVSCKGNKGDEAAATDSTAVVADTAAPVVDSAAAPVAAPEEKK